MSICRFRQATSPIRLFDVPDDRLPPIVDVDVLDPDELVPSMPQAAQNLYLHCEHLHQTSRGGSECGNAPFCSEPVYIGENRHSRRMELVLVQAADGMGDYAMPLSALLKGQAFGPDEIAVLTQAFEQCLVELNLANRKDLATQLVAKAIFDAAKQGERDPKRLSEIATKALSK